MNREVDALKQFFAAINRNDMQAITRDFDPQIVRIEPEGFPTAGTYRGIAERGPKGAASPEKVLIRGERRSWSTSTRGFA